MGYNNKKSYNDIMDTKILTPDNIEDWFMRRLTIVKELNKKENADHVDIKNIHDYFIDKDKDGYY